MPLIEKQAFTDGTQWFHSECKGDRIIAGQTEWNLRHALLRNDAISDWIIEEPVRFEWDLLQNEAVHDSAETNITFLIEKKYRALGIRKKADQLRVEFKALSDRWRRDTRHLSVISKKITHPAYLRIIGMGEAAIPLLLESLRDRPAHWFVALRATANADPSNLEDTPSQAREAWITWGVFEGYID